MLSTTAWICICWTITTWRSTFCTSVPVRSCDLTSLPCLPLCKANRMPSPSSLTLIIDAEHGAPLNEHSEEIPNKETDSLVSKNTAKEKDFPPVLRKSGKENQDLRFWSTLCFNLHKTCILLLKLKMKSKHLQFYPGSTSFSWSYCWWPQCS